jgi:hypothetical protein
MEVRLDLNNPEFQKEWFNLSKDEFNETGNTLRKLSSMDWNQVYHDKGLHWEKIHSVKTHKRREIYSIRLSKKFRAVVHRKDEFMIFVSLHPDHYSAYE